MLNETDSLGIIWDFDGTLFDTRHRNLSVTRAIVRQILGQSPDLFPVLETVEVYDRAQRGVGNWRHFYQHHLGLDEAGTDHAGGHWVDFQLRDETLTRPIEGIAEVIRELGPLPQGIVSQNSREVILSILQAAGLAGYFGSVIGHSEVPVRRQKPEPDGILRCIRELGPAAPAVILFIGDHETDALTAHNANARARHEGRPQQFVSVAAAYMDEVDPDRWSHQPDFVVDHPREILDLVRELAASLPRPVNPPLGYSGADGLE